MRLMIIEHLVTAIDIVAWYNGLGYVYIHILIYSAKGERRRKERFQTSNRQITSEGKRRKNTVNEVKEEEEDDEEIEKTKRRDRGVERQ